MTVELTSFAKVNLGLEVLGRRRDGFHDLRTVFQTIALCDTILIEETTSSEVRIRGDDDRIEWDSRNTIARAFSLFSRRFGKRQGFDVRVKKRIPPGSGLGGGSGNAAVVLLFLNAYFDVGAGLEDLLPLAAQIGADVPFFLVGGTVLGEGIGERLTDLSPLPERKLVLVCPPVRVSTALIFSRLRLTSRPIESKIEVFLKTGNLNALGNDLESTTFRLFPEIQKTKEKMAAHGCKWVLMSGSGAAVVCIPEREGLPGLRREFPHLIETHTIDRRWYFDHIGAWPSGKASAFGAEIRRFESSRPRGYSNETE